MIRILLTATSHETEGTRDLISPWAVLDYQRHCLGRANGDTCLVELLPLPSKSIGHWMWQGFPELQHLHTRKAYQAHYSHKRAAHLAARIREHKPAAVVFYGFTWAYRQWWHRIASVQFDEVSTDWGTLYIGNNEHTVSAITQHPAYRPMKNEYFHEVGDTIAGRLKHIQKAVRRADG